MYILDLSYTINRLGFNSGNKNKQRFSYLRLFVSQCSGVKFRKTFGSLSIVVETEVVSVTSFSRFTGINE